MKLTPYGANMNTVEFNDGRIVLFSYKTAVAVFIPGEGIKRTATKWSMTTTKHINKWVAGTFSPNVTVETVAQAEIETLAAESQEAA